MTGKVLEFPGSPRRRRIGPDARSEIIDQVASSAIILEKVYELIDEGAFDQAREHLDFFDCPPLQKLHGAAVAWLNEVEPV